MTKFLQLIFWIGVASITIAGCNKKHDEKARVAIHSLTQGVVNVKLYARKYLQEITLAESKTDSLGRCVLEVSLKKPVFAIIQIGEKFAEVYLAPGYDLSIQENGKDYKIPPLFSGKGADVNNYVSWINSNVEKIKWANERGISELSINEFFSRFDSLKTVIKNFHQHYVDSVKLSEEMTRTLEDKNKIKFLEVGQEYHFYVMNQIMNEKFEAKKSGKVYREGKRPEDFDYLMMGTPFDTTLLADGYGDYEALLSFYWQNEVNLAADAITLATGRIHLIPLVSDSLIRKRNFPDGIRDYLIARNLVYCLAAFGLTPQTDSVFQTFKRTTRSACLAAVTKIYNEWQAIAPGNPAPPLEGKTQDGKIVSIKDLVGKVVYIDFWATWCGPCKEEIPYSKKLQQAFSNNDKVQFLNVSVDSERANWEKFLTKDKTWTGLHIIIDPDQINATYNTYKMGGVPTFVLIDAAGKIVSMKAPRPSDVKAKKEIERLIGGKS